MQDLLLVTSDTVSYVPIMWLDPSEQAAGSTVITDKSPSALTVSNTGVVVSNEGPMANMKSMYFAGTSWRYLTWSNTMGNLLTGNFTVEFWWKPEGNGVYDIFTQWRQTTGQGGIIISAPVPNTSISYEPFNTSTALLTTPGVVLNEWHHIAYTRTGTTWLCFIDGKIITRTTYAGQKAAIPVNYYIGGYLTSAGVVGTAGRNPLVGKLANFKVYRGAQRVSNFNPYQR